MQISTRPNIKLRGRGLRIHLLSGVKDLLLACAAAVLLSFPSNLAAQTLARPNWAGSGLTAEPWWHAAVFYRISPASFQDSDGDGIGDLRGIAQRMDYLQSLGIDALILEPPFDTNDTAGFDDLLAAASQHHIRLVIALENSPGANVVAQARAWLTRGAAGIEFQAHNTDAQTAADTLAALHQVARTFPGERAILTAFVRQDTAADRGARSQNADLADTPVTFLPQSAGASDSFTAALRQALTNSQLAEPPPAPLLVTDEGFRSAATYAADSDPARTDGLNKIAATLLLASRGAAALLYGQELGLEKPDPTALMQWTPSNLTPAEIERPAEAQTQQPKPRAISPNVYGAYVPYVAPKKVVALATFDPNSLPGFSTHHPSTQPPNPPDNFSESAFGNQRPLQLSASHDAALEDRDQHSLLNFYRRLAQLHHGNPALRDGSQAIFNHDADNALVWVRRAPAGTRTAEPVIIVCNLSPQTLFFSLNDDLAQLHLHPNALRTLATSAAVTPIETTDRFRLPPFSVYIGELYR